MARPVASRSLLSWSDCWYNETGNLPFHGKHLITVSAVTASCLLQGNKGSDI